MYYVNRTETTPNPANLVKTLQAENIYCFHDLEDDLFESGKLLKMILQCTSSGAEPTKYLSITKDKLMEYLQPSHLQPLKLFFQTRFVDFSLFLSIFSPISHLQNSNPLFRDLNLDQVRVCLEVSNIHIA